MRQFLALTILVTLASCTRGTGPGNALCCIDTTMQADRGQQIHERSRRGIIHAGHFTIRDANGQRQEFQISADFVDWESRTEAASAGTITVGNVACPPGSVAGVVVYRTVVPSAQAPSDSTAVVTIEGNSAQYIDPWTSQVFVPKPLDVTIVGATPSGKVQAVSLDEDMILQWDPADFNTAEMRITLNALDSTDSDGLFAQVAGRPADVAGTFTFPQDSLEQFREWNDTLDLFMYRPYKKCTCQGGDPYELSSASWFRAKLVIKK